MVLLWLQVVLGGIEVVLIVGVGGFWIILEGASVEVLRGSVVVLGHVLIIVAGVGRIYCGSDWF